MADETAEELIARAAPSPLVESATGLHEMYLAYVGGGFTETQALWLVGYCVSNGANLQLPDAE